jgi:glycosyltransferase involved in cell wall biosynthesis
MPGAINAFHRNCISTKVPTNFMRNLQRPSSSKGDLLENVLIVAFHFPPFAASSGLLRPLKFCRYLPEFGWQPTVLAPHVRAYEQLDEETLASIPGNTVVVRAFALDTRRHLSILGRYPKSLALPDRWVTWALGGVVTGLRQIRKRRTSVLFTTFPIMSAALMGLILHRWTGLPWVLDLRDPMTEDDYPRDPSIRRFWRSLECRCVRHASRILFTAESTRKTYLERYPDILTTEKCILICNGYDEQDFLHLSIPAPAPVPADRPLRLVHSGLIYPVERDPRPMFAAVARLKKEGLINAFSLQITFRAPGEEDLYRKMLAERGIEDIILLKPHAPYGVALQECADADGLLLFQAANCDHQIPAKVYEYLRLGKPILALTTQTGDTARLLTEVGGSTIASLADGEDIYKGLRAFLEAVRLGNHPLADREKIQRFTRRAQTADLAAIFNDLTAEAPVASGQKTRSFA